MAYSATLSHKRGLISSAEHNRILKLFSRAGLSMDHPQFDGDLLEKATAAILKTRDGKLRAAVPVSPMGDCVFLNDVSHDEMCQALEAHKELMKSYPRCGEGLDAFVDSSDTGYTLQGAPVEDGDADGLAMNSFKNSYQLASGPEGVDGLQSGGKGMANNYSNGISNGYSNGLKETVNGLEGRIDVVAVDGNGSS